MEKSLLFKQISSAVLFGVSSFLLTVVNKIVLTSFKFTSFQVLGLGQIAVTIVFIYLLKKLNFIDYPPFNRGILKKIWPLPLLYFGNMVFGLGATQQLSLPMFTALRRFAIWMTMVGEYYILGLESDYRVKLSVYLMILGALVAAMNDLTFDLVGYVYVFSNNLFTAVNSIFIKRKMNSGELEKYGLMFYNSLLVFFPTLLLAIVSGDLKSAWNFEEWTATFLFYFSISCIMGFVLSYSMITCTDYNSALTVNIIGSIKNICVTYVGMFVGGDYIFTWNNFIGLTFGVLGSVIYTYLVFWKNITPKQVCDDTTEKLTTEV